MRKKLLIPSIISIFLLIVAAFPIKEYGYYILLRWAICCWAIFNAITFYEYGKSGWAWVMGLMVITFNPIIPVHLDKETWQIIDLAAAFLFLLPIFFSKNGGHYGSQEKKNKKFKGGELDKDGEKILVIGKNIAGDFIRHKMCRVVAFVPFAKIQNERLIARKIGAYAFLDIEPEKPAGIFRLFISHKIDFEHLWKAGIERKKDENEEILIVWSDNYKNRFLKPFSAVMPKLGVYIYPKGFFENKWRNPNWHKDLRGEEHFIRLRQELVPIASWKPDVIDWPF